MSDQTYVNTFVAQYSTHIFIGLLIKGVNKAIFENTISDWPAAKSSSGYLVFTLAEQVWHFTAMALDFMAQNFNLSHVW